MKKIIILLIILVSINLKAEEKFSKQEYLKMRASYLKLMESAHPTPAIQSKKSSFREIPEFLLSDGDYAIFQNSNTIGNEQNYTNQKMQNESSIAVNPTNPKNLIASAVDYRDNSATWVYVSDDGGRSWVNKNLGRPFANWRSTNDPSVSFSDDGIAYLVYGGFESDNGITEFKGGNGVFFARSTDQGKTWTAHIPVIAHTAKQTLDSAFEDKYYIESDNSKESPYYHRLYNPWKRVINRDSSTQIVISHSTDKGFTWSKPVVVCPRLAYSSEDTTYGQSFPLAETAPNGDVYVVWNNGIKHAVGFNKSTDGGETWGEPRLIQKYNIFGVTKKFKQGWRHSLKGTVRAEAYPVLRCDNSNGPRRGTLYLIWSADRIPNIYFSKSTDGGENWSTPKIVHSTDKNDQFWPWLDIDPVTGDIGVMYFDSRRFDDNLKVECWVSYSNDGGETWVDRAASDISHDIRLNPFEENVFAGDYSGMSFYNGIMYPSWVDMRFAVNDLSDSDVFTAIIDTRAPMPPENFKAKTILDNPYAIKLTWDNPTKRSFGQELKTDEYSIIIKRDSLEVQTLVGQTQFDDNKLDAFTKHKYEIFAQSNDGRTSMSRFAEAWAGGSPLPAPCNIETAKGEENFDVLLEIKMPTKRLDGITPLVNLSKMSVYRDGALVGSVNLTPSDTGKIIKYSDNTTTRGWYKYHCIISDKMGDLVTESEPSNMKLVYSGENLLAKYPYSPYEDDFTTAKEYYSTNGWHLTEDFAYSSFNSMTIAENGTYKQSQKDTLMLYPVAGMSKINLAFRNAAIVHNNDEALVEYSLDNGKIWSNIASYNYKQYEFWGDNVLDNKDWKYEILTIDASQAETLLIRFVFNSNNFKELQGWYIDDIEISRWTQGVQDTKFELYPNPAESYIMIVSQNNMMAYEIFDVYGRIMIKGVTENINSRIDLEGLVPGMYFIKIADKIVKFIKL